MVDRYVRPCSVRTIAVVVSLIMAGSNSLNMRHPHTLQLVMDVACAIGFRKCTLTGSVFRSRAKLARGLHEWTACRIFPICYSTILSWDKRN